MTSRIISYSLLCNNYAITLVTIRAANQRQVFYHDQECGKVQSSSHKTAAATLHSSLLIGYYAESRVCISGYISPVRWNNQVCHQVLCCPALCLYPAYCLCTALCHCLSPALCHCLWPALCLAVILFELRKECTHSYIIGMANLIVCLPSTSNSGLTSLSSSCLVPSYLLPIKYQTKQINNHLISKLVCFLNTSMLEYTCNVHTT